MQVAWEWYVYNQAIVKWNAAAMCSSSLVWVAVLDVLIHRMRWVADHGVSTSSRMLCGCAVAAQPTVCVGAGFTHTMLS